MADLSKTIEIIFDGVDKTAGALGKVTNDLSSLTSGVAGATAGLAGLTNSFLKVEAAAVVVGAALLAVAINDAVKMESALLDLQKVMDEGDGSANEYVGQIEALSLKFGESQIAVTEMAAEWKAAGFTMDEVFGSNGKAGLVETTLEAVKVSMLDSGEATETFKGILAGFGLPAEEVRRALDAINEVEGKTGASFEDLAEGLSLISPIAETTGLSLEEMTGLLVPVIDVFHDGSQSADGLKTALLRLGGDTKSVTDALDKLGISNENANGSMKSVKQILDELAKVWPTLTDAQKGYYAAELAGIEQAPKLLALLNNYDKALQVTEIAMNSAGSAQKELNIRLASAEEAGNRAKVAFEQLSISIGNQFLGSFKDAANSVTSVETAMKQVVDSGGLEPLFALLRPLMEKFSADLNDIAKNLPAAMESIDWSAVQIAASELGEALGKLFSGIDLSTPEGLGRAIQTLVDILAGMIQITAGVVEGLTPFLRGLAEAALKANELGGDAQKTGGYVLGLATAINAVANFAGAALTALQAIAGIFGVLAASQVVQTVTALSTALGTGGLAAAASAVGPVLAPIAALLAGYSFGGWIDGALGLSKEFTGLNASGIIADDALARMDFSLKQLSTAAGEPIKDMQEFNAAMNAGVPIWDNINEKWINGSGALTKVDEAVSDTKVSFDEFGNIVIEAGQGFLSFDSATSGATTTMGRQADAAQKSTSRTEELNRALSEMANDSALKQMEFSMELNIAEVEANAKIASSVLDGLASTITSTGTLLGTLFGLLANPESQYQDKILKQIEDENAMRKEAFALQKELSQAQIDYMKARTEAITKNNALITIDGAGLQPQLEAFMWEILRAIQVRVNEDGLEMLVGL